MVPTSFIALNNVPYTNILSSCYHCLAFYSEIPWFFMCVTFKLLDIFFVSQNNGCSVIQKAFLSFT